LRAVLPVTIRCVSTLHAITIRPEHHAAAAAGGVQVSQDTYNLLGDLQEDFELRTDVSVKGKGVMNTYVTKDSVAQRIQGEGEETSPW
jgi:hypothetical protein